MKRIYTDVSRFRSPYASVMFAGLGAAPSHRWPPGRSYHDISQYRSPYQDGYFQNNTLWGLGYDPTPADMQTPPPQPPAPTSSLVLVGGALAAVAAMIGIAWYVSHKAPGMDEGAGVRL